MDKKLQEHNQQQTNTPKCLRIYTLGNFSVITDDHNLTNEFDNSLKLWELFKYLITFKNELIPPERIIDSLWPDAEYADPKRTLRALIYRLRKVLNRHDPNNENCVIVYSQGCYILRTSKSCSVDVVEFENLFLQAHGTLSNEEESIDLYKKVIYMYKGEYLSTTTGHNWLTPARNYYRRMFFQSVFEVSDLLKEQKRHKEIIEICELAIKHDLFEEEVHLRYIEALAASGKIKRAKSHYEYVVKVFDREMGVKPSRNLKRLYNVIFGEKIKPNASLSGIAKKLEEEFLTSGPMICELDFFKFHYQIEVRRAERNGHETFLGLVTLSKQDHSVPDEKQRKRGMCDLEKILISNLRKGDIITQLNEGQFLVSFPCKCLEHANKVLMKIKNRFGKERKEGELKVLCTIETSLPEQSDNYTVKHY